MPSRSPSCRGVGQVECRVPAHLLGCPSQVYHRYRQPCQHRQHQAGRTRVVCRKPYPSPGLFVRSVMKAQAASLLFTPVFAALVSIINTKLPQVGELLLTRLQRRYWRTVVRHLTCMRGRRLRRSLVPYKTARPNVLRRGLRSPVTARRRTCVDASTMSTCPLSMRRSTTILVCTRSYSSTGHQ
jgi:hypothetical protein